MPVGKFLKFGIREATVVAGVAKRVRDLGIIGNHEPRRTQMVNDQIEVMPLILVSVPAVIDEVVERSHILQDPWQPVM